MSSSILRLSDLGLFPGQGSQQVGMGKELYRDFPSAREVFEEASAAISVSLEKLCFDASEAELRRTENTQPCLLAVSVAAFRVVEKELGVQPALLAGHSLGEYSALVCSRRVDLTTATRWVRQRGQAMQNAVPEGAGAMTAILGWTDEQVKALCQAASQNKGSCVEPANFNAPGQVVISGTREGVEEAERLLKTPEWKGARAIRLEVSIPSHCSLMKPAKEVLKKVFQQIPNLAPKTLQDSRDLIPYLKNSSGTLAEEGASLEEGLLDQLDHPVLWKQSMEYALQKGFRRVVEYGVGAVLSGLFKRTAAAHSFECQFFSIQDLASFKKWEHVLSHREEVKDVSPTG